MFVCTYVRINMIHTHTHTHKHRWVCDDKCNLVGNEKLTESDVLRSDLVKQLLETAQSQLLTGTTLKAHYNSYHSIEVWG